MSMKSFKINSYKQDLEKGRLNILDNSFLTEEKNVKTYSSRKEYHRAKEEIRLKEIIQDYENKNDIERANEYQEELNKYIKRNAKLELSNSFKTFKDNLINFIKTSIKLKK